MNAYIYLLPIFLPIVLGCLLLAVPVKRNVPGWVCFAVSIPVAVLVWAMAINPPVTGLVVTAPAGKLEVGFCLDGAGKIFAMMASALWPIASLYGVEYMKHDPRQRSFFGFYLMCLGVTMGVAMAENLLTMYIFYEFLTICTVPLVVHPLTAEAVKATRKYMYMSFGGTAFGFIALIFVNVYGSAGPFVAGGMFDVSQRSTLLTGVWLMGFLGFGVKAAVFPLHGWLPDAAVAPTPVTALLHAVAVVKSGVFAVVRLTYYCFGAAFLQGTVAQKLALGLVIFTTLFGSVAAVKEQHIKRRLAYSTVANLSYVLIGFLLLTPEGATAGFLHMVAHGIMKIGAFFCVGAMMEYAGVTHMHQLGGMGKRMPFTIGCYTLLGLGLAGLPPTIGFVSKFRLITAGLAEGSVWGIIGGAALILCGVLTMIYMLSVTVKAFFAPAAEGLTPAHPAETRPGAAMCIAFGAVTVATVALGLYCEPLVQWIARSAAQMF